MSEEFFVYHFNGGTGLSGAFSEVGDSGEAGVSTEYGYLVNDEEIPALDEHLVHVAELEGGLSPVRDADREVYQKLRNSPQEAISEVRDRFNGRMEDYDLMNIFRTPVDGFATSDDISYMLSGERELKKTARKGFIEGHRENVMNTRAKDSTINQVDFYTNNFDEEELDELEEIIKNL